MGKSSDGGGRTWEQRRTVRGCALALGQRMRPVLRGLQIAAVAVLLSGVAMAEWESIGGLQPGPRKGNEFPFHNAHATVVLQVLAPDLIRVRAVHASSLPPDHSYAV